MRRSKIGNAASLRLPNYRAAGFRNDSPPPGFLLQTIPQIERRRGFNMDIPDWQIVFLQTNRIPQAVKMRISGFVEQLRFLNGANRKPWKISIHGFIRKDFENGAEVGSRKRAQNPPVNPTV